MQRKKINLKLSKKIRYKVESDEENEEEKEKAEEKGEEKKNEEKQEGNVSPARSESPDEMFLCTQQDQVNWNWSPDTKNSKSRNKSDVEFMTTPKTTQLKNQKLKEKKGSPLMYLRKPEMISSENKASMERFLNMFTDKNQNQSPIVSTNNEELNSKDEVKHENGIENEKKEELSLTPVRKVAKKQKSFDNLFNDSMDDELILCSQEIENRYLANTQSQNHNDFGLSMSRRRSLSPTFRNMCDAAKKPKPATSNDSLNKSVSSLSIPDDSFDDCLASCIFDESKVTKVYARTNIKITQCKSFEKIELKNTTTTPSTRKFMKHTSSPVISTTNMNQGNRSSSSSRGTVVSNQIKLKIEQKRKEALRIRELKEKEKRLLKTNNAMIRK